jgi:hypothetical protein
MKYDPNHQKLVDLCFEFAIMARCDPRVPTDREAVARWVSDNLRGCGFNTTARGSSWGVLVQEPGPGDD